MESQTACVLGIPEQSCCATCCSRLRRNRVKVTALPPDTIEFGSGCCFSTVPASLPWGSDCSVPVNVGSGTDGEVCFESYDMPAGEVLQFDILAVLRDDGVALHGVHPRRFERRRELVLEDAARTRLIADADALARLPAAGITAGLLQKVRAFAGGAPQSDDIAIMTLKFVGKGTEATHL